MGAVPFTDFEAVVTLVAEALAILGGAVFADAFGGIVLLASLGSLALETGDFAGDGALDAAGAELCFTAFATGVGFLPGTAVLRAFKGSVCFASFSGGLEPPCEDLAGFPEDFRDGEVLEIFFNGSQVKPKSRARKDR